MKELQKIINFLYPIILTYLCIAFIFYDFDIRNWGVAGRVAYVFLGTLVGVSNVIFSKK